MTRAALAERPTRLLILGALAAGLLTLMIEAAISGPIDTAGDAVDALTRLVQPLAAVTPVAIVVLIVTSILHHLAAACAARAAAGAHLPVGELVATTYAAAAANRITPAGLGGAAILGRFFVRRGGLQTPQATAAVSALAVLGALADCLAFAALIGVGVIFGVPQMVSEAPHLVSMLAGLAPVPGVAWPAVAGLILVLLVTTGLVLRRRGPALAARGAAHVRRYQAQLAGLARQPLRMAALLAGSGATTLSLAAGFAIVAILPPVSLPAHDIGVLMVGYMLAAAAGNALPTPGGVGSAEVALIGVLLVQHVPASGALATVLAFRLVTFWAPAVAGIVLSRPLRRRGAL